MTSDLPPSAEIEQMVLGKLLGEPIQLRACDALRPEHFAVEIHETIYETITVMAEGGLSVTPATVKLAFANDPRFDPLGGAGAYLAQLSMISPPSFELPGLVSSLLEFYQRDAYARLMATEADAAMDLSMPLDERIEAVQRAVVEIAGGLAADLRLAHMSEAFKESTEAVILAHQHPEQAFGVTTGLPRLDDVLIGLQRGDLILAAGRPGMGKSGVASSIARAAAEAGHPSASFLLEMKSPAWALRQQTERATGAGSPVTYHDARKGAIDLNQLQAISDAGTALSELDLYVNDAGRMTVDQIRADCKALARRLAGKGKRLDLVIIDHFGLVHDSGNFRGNKVAAAGEISNACKALAKELDCAVLLLCQLSREVEKRDDKRPVMSDLRWAGDLEQDADSIIFLYRDTYYLEQQNHSDPGEEADRQAMLNASKDLIEFIVAKNRMGPTKTLIFHFDIKTNTLIDKEGSQQGMDL